MEPIKEINFPRHKSNLDKLDKIKNKQTFFSEMYHTLIMNFKHKKKNQTRIPSLILYQSSNDRINSNNKMQHDNVVKPNQKTQNIEILKIPETFPKIRKKTDIVKEIERKNKSKSYRQGRISIKEKVFIHDQKIIEQTPNKLSKVLRKDSETRFDSILSKKNKSILAYSKGNINQNPQSYPESLRQKNQSHEKHKDRKIFISEKTQVMNILSQNTERASYPLKSIKKQKVQQTQLLSQQYQKVLQSYRKVFDDSFAKEKMTGKKKNFTAHKKSKKAKMNSLQKIYGGSYGQKPIIGLNIVNSRKINWKCTGFPLSNIDKSQINKIFLRYLRLQGCLSVVQTGFYKFYLGQGNNSQIIKNALKNRGHWQQVYSLSQKPHLIWTQLPLNEVQTFQTKCVNYQLSPKKSVLQFDVQKKEIQSFIKNQGSNYIKSCQKLLTNELFHNFTGKILDKFKGGHKLNNYLMVQKQTKRYINSYKTIKITSNQQPPSQNNAPFKNTEIHIQNHVKNSHQIGNKKSLYKVFLDHCIQHSDQLSNYIPTTLNILFQDILTQQRIISLVQNNIKQGPWIVKPGQETNRGRGIVMAHNITHLVKEVMKRNRQFINSGKGGEGYEKSVIIQKYIDPMLYENRKFDIRMWVLWSKNQLWWYKQGYLRTSCKQYKAHSTNRFIHLTNDAVQIQSQDYGKYQPGNKLSFQQFHIYLSNKNNNNTNQPTSQPKTKYDFKGHIYSQMKQITKKLFAIARDYLFQDTLNFQLFGLDFLVDKNGKVWLIECNTNPSLEIHCSLQSRLLPNLIQGVLNIVIDPIFCCPSKKISRQSINTVFNQQNFRFQILFDGDQQQIIS